MSSKQVRRSTRITLGVAATSAAMLALAACGTAGHAASGTGSTVAVDVGAGSPIKLSTGSLKIGIFMNDTTNAWEQGVVKGAEAAAAKYGWSTQVLTPSFNVQTQMNQLQTAATSHQFDAIVAIPVDGSLECNVYSKILPAANVLVAIGAQQLCGKTMASGDQLWQPGTLNFVGGTGTTADYVRSWLNHAAQENPGPQQVAYVVGPQILTVQQMEKQIVDNEFQAAHPDFKINNFIYTDYTTANSYQQTLNYLNAHKDTTVILSSYSPDMTRGVIEAVKAAGLEGKVTVVDSGGSTYSAQQLEAGTIQFTTPLFPMETGQYMVDAIKAAQEGKAPQRFVSDIPPALGSPTNLFFVTKSNLSTFKPEF